MKIKKSNLILLSSDDSRKGIVLQCIVCGNECNALEQVTVCNEIIQCSICGDNRWRHKYGSREMPSSTHNDEFQYGKPRE